MTSLMKRISGTMVIEVRGANPNGSPDHENRPRLVDFGDPQADYNEHGFITPMCLKRRFRNVLADHESPCFLEICEKLGIDPEQFHILESRDRGFKDTEPQEAVKLVKKLIAQDSVKFSHLAERYWDYRLLGTVLLEEKDRSDAVKKPLLHCIKTGCLTISPALSVSPVRIVEATIVKVSPYEEDKKSSNGKDTKVARNIGMAPNAYKFVQHGLYVAQFDINPHVARHTFATELDVEVLKAILPVAHLLDMSGARPAGAIRPVHIWWREHDSALGSFNVYKFWENLQPKRTRPGFPSSSLEDYEIPDGREFGAVDLMERFLEAETLDIRPFTATRLSRNGHPLAEGA